MNNSKNIKNQIYELLKEVIDPELGLNIIDLGLVYEVECSNENTITIIMTLTSPGCPMGDSILENIKNLINREYSAYEVEVQLTFEPVWSTGHISPEGKMFLGMA